MYSDQTFKLQQERVLCFNVYICLSLYCYYPWFFNYERGLQVAENTFRSSLSGSHVLSVMKTQPLAFNIVSSPLCISISIFFITREGLILPGLDGSVFSLSVSQLFSFCYNKKAFFSPYKVLIILCLFLMCSFFFFTVIDCLLLFEICFTLS